MKKGLFTILAAGMLASAANAIVIDLQNAADGSAKITLSPTADGNVNLVIITNTLDTFNVSFVNAFLDSSNDDADVVGLTEGQPGWDKNDGSGNSAYDRSAFKLPAELDEAGGNEYGLVTGDQDFGDALPNDGAAHIIDILTLHSDNVSGSTTVTFETGRLQAFANADQGFEDWIIFPGLPPGLPGVLYPGDKDGTNSPFEINYVPEPASLGLLALGGLAAIRRRR